jgi:hypothetical protein
MKAWVGIGQVRVGRSVTFPLRHHSSGLAKRSLPHLPDYRMGVVGAQLRTIGGGKAHQDFP